MIRTERHPSPEAGPALHRIVVGIDFAAPSLRAAHWVDTHFGDAELVLAHAVDFPRLPQFIGDAPAARQERLVTAREGAKMRLDALRSRLQTERVATFVRAGAPATTLARLGHTTNAALVVVGEHGERTGLSRMLGSTPRRLLNQAARPVLLSRSEPAQRPRRIIAALDDSPRAPAVARWSLGLARRFRANVTLLGVVSASMAGLVGVGARAQERERAVEHLREDAVARLEAQRDAAGATGGGAELLVTAGDAAHEILRVADRLDADLVVMGLRRAAALERALIGVTAHTVLRDARASVLVVLPPSEEA